MDGYYWKIWYDDGTSFTGVTEEDWNSFSTHGIIQAKEFNRPDKPNLIHHGLNYYFFEGGQIISTNDIALYIIRSQGVKSVKIGRWANNYIWDKAVEEGMSNGT